MVENPVTGLLGIMREQGAAKNPTVCLTGQVLSVSPLKIKAGGIELDSDDILISSSLKVGYTRQITYTGPVCETSGTSGTVKLTNAGFTVGDIVLLFPSPDGQQYYLTDKLEAV